MGEWNFPSNNFGNLNGIGEAGIETFRGSPYTSLAREVCQNSMDARLNNDEPTVVEFACTKIPTNSIPDYNNLRDAFDLCLEFWKEANIKKTVGFFKNAIKVIQQSSISVLRISDFNTTGLTGSDKEYNTPWQNLVKASGVSDKADSAGGSYGIGKSAPFACSEIRTLFYTTIDKDGLKASQGIARLASFRKRRLFQRNGDNITTGIGYYSSDKKNNPIRSCISIVPDYKRTSIGTDVYVIGFIESRNWRDEIIGAVLEGFLIAIYKNELIVRVDGIEISCNTLERTIEDYKIFAPAAYNYFHVLSNKGTRIIQHSFDGLGTVELRVLISQGLHRRVMMCRKNGMKIFDQKNISSTIQFAGICVLQDDKINAYFREMENPQHDAWEPERHTKVTKTAAKKSKQMLSKFIKDSVIDLGRNTTVDEVDAEGMGEYLADVDFMDTGNQNQQEVITDVTKNIEISIKKAKNNQKGIAASESGANTYDELAMDDNVIQTFGDYGSKDFYDDEDNESHNGNGFGGGDGDGPGTNGIGTNSYYTPSDKETGKEGVVRKKVNIGFFQVRLFNADRTRNHYRITFTPKKSFAKGYLQINLCGEQNSLKAPVAFAQDIETKTPLTFKNNKIFLENIEKNKRRKISFRLIFSEESSLEVHLFGYSS